MALHDLFPTPQQLTRLGASIDLSGRAIVFSPSATLPPLAQRGLDLVQAGQPPAAVSYPITVQIDPADPAWAAAPYPAEAYRLELNERGGHLVANEAAGIFVGCQTLRQLLQGKPATLPALQIVDWPDFRYRGLYVESKWGPDLMTLDDWRALIDYMAALKFNSLGVGVYGCWVVQYGGQTTEFMLLPFPDHPALTTPRTLRYYAPSTQAWQTLTYLPRMAAEDFFGEVVAYAKANNITVRPHFNAPGHNTLIPRAYPEVSAKDEAGNPLGYGFCLTNPRTYELLFTLYDSVIERYLRPHGIDWFHIGLDEVTGYMGIDPNKPFEILEPWCHCPACREQSHAEQLQTYTVRVCAHLKAQGINHITLWNDGLERLGGLNADFVQMLDAAGVRGQVVVQWWRYREPTLIPRQELGLRAWVTPMAGYWSNLFTQSYTSNIYPMLLHGHRVGAEGADAYCIYDPAFDRNYCCLAQYAWNQRTSEDLYQFKSRYAQAKLGAWLDPALAAEAFAKYDQAFDAMSWTETVLDSLLYYWHTYPAARQRGRYPYSVLADLLDEHVRLRGAFDRLVAHAKAARDLFAQANQQAHDPLLDAYRAECDKVIGVWAFFATLVQMGQRYRQAAKSGADRVQSSAQLTQLDPLLTQARVQLITVLTDLEQVKASYLRPQVLRDLSILLVYVNELRAEIAALAQELNAERLAALPAFAALQVNQRDLDPAVSTVQS
ncbi:MAG: family 20 glycosylhydrolase [Caldilineaceae bacterium]